MTGYDLYSDIEDTIAVRNEEDFDHRSIYGYLRSEILELPSGPLDVRQFPSGASNLTYLLRIGSSWEGVLRRPPFGPVAPSAHDMKREFRILSRLHPVFPLAPRPYLFCDNAGLLGASFYLMERRHGVVLNDKIPSDTKLDRELARHISELTVSTLVKLHAVDWKGAGLSEVGHPEGFLERQVRGWIERYDRAKTEAVREMDKLISWFPKNIPDFDASQATIIHNDYKLNNIMLDKQFQNVVAVFDWEMTTIGDPLFDLAVTLSYWFEPNDPEDLRAGLPTVTTVPGFYTRKEFLNRYAQLSGREIRNIEFYAAFAYFKLAVINQQIYFRWKAGQTHDSRFGPLGDFVPIIARQGLNLIT